MKRYELLDCIKGGLIVLVVLGHITLCGDTPGWYKCQYLAISCFHMPLFFAVSGFLFGDRDWNKRTLSIIMGKSIALGIPYIIFDISYVVFNCILQDYVQTNNRLNWSYLPRLFWVPAAHYWFLWSLVLYAVVAAVCKNKKVLWILGFIISLVILILFPMRNTYIAYMYKLLGFYFFYVVGAEIGRNKEAILPYIYKLQKYSSCIFMLTGLLFSLCVFIIYKIGKVPFDCFEHETNIALLNIIAAVLGSLVFINVVSYLCKDNHEDGWFKTCLAYLGRNTWYIFLLHSYFTSLARVIVRLFSVYNIIWQVLIGLVLGIGGPLVIACISKRFSLFNAMFYPAKYLNTLK